MSGGENIRHDSGSPDALWDARDVASYLKASRSWVYQKAEAGLLPCLRVCGLLRFDPEAVKAWAQKDAAPVIPLRGSAP